LTSRFGTGPVEAGFWVAAHVNLKPDIRALDAFVPTSAYGSQEPVLQAEFGATDEARWVTSTLVTVTSANPPVYYNTFVGANAYGYVGIDEVSTEMILKPLGKLDAEYKPTLIDMEARWGDMAQAKAA
jgi:N4-gp56 family major capsid protein